MKKSFFSVSLLALAATLGAQQAPTDFSGAAKNQYNQNKRFILSSAEKMPAENFGWRPADLEPELRTFGQILAHIANENNQTCSRLTGKPNPAHLDGAKGVFTPAEATRFLNDSFAVCDPLFN